MVVAERELRAALPTRKRRGTDQIVLNSKVWGETLVAMQSASMNGIIWEAFVMFLQGKQMWHSWILV